MIGIVKAWHVYVSDPHYRELTKLPRGLALKNTYVEDTGRLTSLRAAYYSQVSQASVERRQACRSEFSL